jgi:sigma-E factor negative regulatory protein RseA
MGSIMGSVSMQSLAPSRAERLSAFVDGQGSSELGLDQEIKQFLGEFSDEDRTLWAEYHLVGDVLKSEDLATDPAADAAFLTRFSASFASEPPLLAPAAHVGQPSSGLTRLTRRFLPSLAVAAAAATLTWVLVPQQQGSGSAAPVGAMQAASVDTRSTAVQGAGVQRVAMMAPASGSGSDLGSGVPVASAPASAPADVNMIRDARLDQYLDAHQQFTQRPVPQNAPFVRNVSAQEEH